MANIDLKQAATKGYVEGDEYLTKDSSGGLNWTPAHEAPYELLENDISSGTSTKGLVSGEQLAALGGSEGGGDKIVLISDDGNLVNSWQHLIKSADLVDASSVTFLLGFAEPSKTYSVCIPSEVDLPALSGISEMRFIVYNGSGTSAFSSKFNGSDLDTTVVGTETLAGTGCLIARKTHTDTWFLTKEVVGGDGPEVLKNWTTVTATSENLVEGITDLSGVSIEIRKLSITQGGLLITLRMSKTGKDFSGLFEQSSLASQPTITAAAAETNEFRPFYKPATSIPSNQVGSAFNKVYSSVVTLHPSEILDNGVFSMISAKSSGAGGHGSLQNTGNWLSSYVYKTKGDVLGGVCTELWLDFEGSAAGYLTYEYRVLRNN